MDDLKGCGRRIRSGGSGRARGQMERKIRPWGQELAGQLAGALYHIQGSAGDFGR